MSRSPTGSVPHTASSPPSARPSGARGRGRWGTPYVAWRSGCGRRASRCTDRRCSCAAITCSASAPSPWTRCSRATRWGGPRARAGLPHQEGGTGQGGGGGGGSALEKREGPQRPDVEVETVRFREQLARALAGDAEPPRLELRVADGELRTDEG